MSIYTALSTQRKKPILNYKIFGLLISSLFAISACSSSSKTADEEMLNSGLPDGSDNNVSRISSLSESVDSFEGVVNLGWFYIDESDQISNVNSSAAFFEVGSENAQVNPVADYLFTAGDTCVVEPESLGVPTRPGYINETYRTISVGEVITLFEVDEPYKYSELAHLGLADEGRYINYQDLPYPSPVSLNVSAVGDAFNAFSLTVEKPAAVSGLSIVNGQAIAPGATIRWTASADDDTLLNIRLEESTDTFSTFVVNCMLIDDGEFSLPTTLDIDPNALTILQVATRLRAGSTRVDTDQVVVVRGASRSRNF